MSEVVSADFSESEFNENNTDKYRPLAWVEILTQIHSIDGADSIDMAKTSTGNEVIVKKGEFNPGDECIYVTTDTFLPEDNRWEFLRINKFKVKCKKIRGAWSDGLILPLSIIPESVKMAHNAYDGSCMTKPLLPFGPGYDLTNILGVKKIPEKAIPNGSGGIFFGKAAGKFPIHTPKTDEDNLAGLKPHKLLEAHKGKIFRKSIKLHGSSCSLFLVNNEFGVCSRNLQVKDSDNGLFWQAAKKYEIENKLRNFRENDPDSFDLTVQGEICGPKLNGNIYNFTEIRFFVHNIYNVDKKQHLTQKEMVALAEKLNLEVCPGEIFVLDHTLEQLVEMVEKPSIYNKSVPEEGCVFRLWDSNEYCDIVKGRLSFKIVSRLFKEKYKK